MNALLKAAHPKTATRKAQRISRRAPQWLVSPTGRAARVTVLGRLVTSVGTLILVRQDQRLYNERPARG